MCSPYNTAKCLIFSSALCETACAVVGQSSQLTHNVAGLTVAMVQYLQCQPETLHCSIVAMYKAGENLIHMWSASCTRGCA